MHLHEMAQMMKKMVKRRRVKKERKPAKSKESNPVPLPVLKKKAAKRPKSAQPKAADSPSYI